MISSGVTAIATSGADSMTLIATPAGTSFNYLRIVNTGTVDGFFSVDGGSTWGYIPAGATGAPAKVKWEGKSSSPVLMKRAGDSDMTGVYAFADWRSSGGNG